MYISKMTAGMIVPHDKHPLGHHLAGRPCMFRANETDIFYDKKPVAGCTSIAFWSIASMFVS